jgi:glycosyl transferase family 25
MRTLQTLVISLQHSEQRRIKVAQQMAKTSLTWRFLDAVDGALLDLEKFPYKAQKVKRLLGFELTPKELGCYMSHMKAWQACVNENIPTLIFEDDFVVESTLVPVLNALLQPNEPWELVRLQALCESEEVTIKSYGEFRLVVNKGDPLGATAYLINPASARRLLEKSAEIYEPLDHYIEHIEKHGVVMMAVKPYPVTVTDPTRATSTITDRPDRASIRGLRKLVRSFHRLLDRSFSPNPYFPKSQ